MKSRTHSALTLVELIVAIAILSLAFAGSTSLYYQTATFSRSSGQRAEARTLAEAQLATLRRTLRSAPLVNGTSDNRDTQFTTVLAQVGAQTNATTYQGSQNITLDRGRVNAVLTTTAYVAEAPGETALGLTAGTLDLDADGTLGANTAIANADLWALPVTVTVTWRPAENTSAAATETVTVTGVLY